GATCQEIGKQINRTAQAVYKRLDRHGVIEKGNRNTQDSPTFKKYSEMLKSMSQKEVAKACGVSRQAVNKVLRGRR
ncbi:helix-turn-helix transcriptional regulator, partial [Candidatus Babeliales bacterium]|nr:helix-turn-helix transcriptional regulator [Candidatus Babeliales bacterium]